MCRGRFTVHSKYEPKTANNKRLTQKIKTNSSELLWGNERRSERRLKQHTQTGGLTSIDKNHEISFNLKIK